MDNSKTELVNSNRRLRLVSLLLVFGGLWLLAGTLMPILPDEAYYWTWAQSPGSHYFDHPPGVAWLLAGSDYLFGHSRLALRLLPFVSIYACLHLSVLTTRRLVNHDLDVRNLVSDEIVLLIFLSSPMFVIGFIPMTPDPIQGGLAAACAYTSVRALEVKSHGFWSFLAALLFVLGVGVKHYAAFIAAGALLGVVLHPMGRRRLKTFWPWIGILLGLIVLSPWLWAEMNQESSTLWQYRRAIYGRANRGLIALPLMLGSLMGTMGPLNAILLIRTVFFPREQFVLSFGAASLLLACLVAVWAGSGEANWPISAFVFAVPLIAVQLFGSPKRLSLFRKVAWVSAAINAVILIHAAYPFLPTQKIHDPTKRGAGFAKLAQVTEEMIKAQADTVVVVERYQVASLLRYHLQDRWPVHELTTLRARKSQFDLWARPPLCPQTPIVWVSPGPKVPDWLSPTGLSSESTRRRVERGVEGRKVLNIWYLTLGRIKSTAPAYLTHCGSDVPK